MSAPLYFLPGLTRDELVDDRQRLRGDLLADRGLLAVLADCATAEHVALCNVTNGPERRSGVVVCALPVGGKAAPPRVGYYPEAQTWSAEPGEESELWLGLDATSPVEPEDLLRRRPIDGYVVKLSDDLRVSVPIVRRPNGTSELPQQVDLVGAEGVRMRVKASHAALWERTAVAVDWLFGDGGQPRKIDQLVDIGESFSLAAAVRLALECLAVNYRFDARLQNRLHWLDSANWATVLGAATDLFGARAILAAEKKSDPSTGAEASIT